MSRRARGFLNPVPPRKDSLHKPSASVPEVLRKVLSALRSWLPTLGLCGLIFYFGYHAMTGDRGLLEEDARRSALAARSAEYARVNAQRVDLERRAELLRDGHLSRDLLDERARALLGYADPRDYVVRVNR